MEKGYILAILGSSVDYFYKANHYPVEGDYSHVIEGMKSAGGPSLNMGCVSSSHGAFVKALDYLNPDEEATSIILKALKDNNVDISNIQYGDCQAGKVIIIDTNDKRTMFVCDPIRPKYQITNKLQELLNNSAYMYSMLHIIERSFDDFEPIRKAKLNGSKMIFDGCSKYDNPSRVKMLVELADGLFINTTDYACLKEALKKEPKDVLLDNGCQFVCVTDGSKGATLYTKEKEYYEKAMAIKPIETTGAGDSFAGTFLYSLQKGDDYQTALHLATAGGAYNCLFEGGLGGVCSRKELDDFMKKNNF